MRQLLLGCVILSWFNVVGCGKKTANPYASILASSFNQSCQTASDCVAVYSGEVCGVCGCANAVINSADVNSYNAELEADDASCSSSSSPSPPAACNCPSGVAPTCLQNQCTLPVDCNSAGGTCVDATTGTCSGHVGDASSYVCGTGEECCLPGTST